MVFERIMLKPGVPAMVLKRILELEVYMIVKDRVGNLTTTRGGGNPSFFIPVALQYMLYSSRVHKQMPRAAYFGRLHIFIVAGRRHWQAIPPGPADLPQSDLPKVSL